MVNKGMGSLTDIRRKLSYDHELIATCYHESGHTISGLLNYMMIGSVGIEITKDKRKHKDLGYTNFETALDFEQVLNKDLAQNLIISEIHINYAGLAAEKIFYKDLAGTDKLPMVLKHGSYMDRDSASDLIKKNNLAPAGKKRHLYKKRLFTQSKRSLENYWSDVKLISHALFDKRKLYFIDLKNILQRKSENKAFWKQQFKDIDVVFEAAKNNDEDLVFKILSR